MVLEALGAMALLALALAVRGSPIYSATPTEIAPSVLLLGMFDWEPYDKGSGSRCIDMVKRAAGLGISRVNYVITVHHQDHNHDGSVDAYCYMKSGGYCEGVHQRLVDQFRQGLTACFTKANKLGLDISIVPHLDEGVRQHAAWRNSMLFDPLAKLQGWTYEEVLLNPVADALAAALSSERKVWIAMQGEMSATVLRYPHSYATVKQRLQQRIHGGKGQLSRVKVGLSFNFNKLHTGDDTLVPVAMLAGPADVLADNGFAGVPNMAGAGGNSSSKDAGGSSSSSSKDAGSNSSIHGVEEAMSGSGDSGGRLPSAGDGGLQGGGGVSPSEAFRHGHVSGPQGGGAEVQATGDDVDAVRPAGEGRALRAPFDWLWDGVAGIDNLLSGTVGGGGGGARRGGFGGFGGSGGGVGGGWAAELPRPSSDGWNTGSRPAAASSQAPPSPTPTSAPPAPSPGQATSGVGSGSGYQGKDSYRQPQPEHRRPPAPAPTPMPRPLSGPSLWDLATGQAPPDRPPAPSGWHPSRGGVDINAVQSLLKSIDFIGISAYSEMLPGFEPKNLQNSAFRFFNEVKQGLGLDLPDLMHKHNIELHYSEFGLGGGIAEDGSAPAQTAWQAGTHPFLGVWGTYKKSQDPWQNPQVRSYMHQFYEQTSKWLKQGGGPSYYASALFLWNVGSWDVLGIYPESSISGQGSYRDQVVVDLVCAHNKAVRQMKAASSKG